MRAYNQTDWGRVGPTVEGRNMTKTILTALLVLGWALCPQAEVATQQAVMVWGPACINSITKQPSTRIEAPMKDGRPDYSQVRVYREVVNFIPECGHIEVRR